VRPRRPEGFPRHRQRNWRDEATGGASEGVLQNVQGNLSRLTHRIPMVQVEHLPEAMQRQVIGVPRACDAGASLASAWSKTYQRLGTCMGAQC
jgi:hypothetical protein